ncbi:MAG: tetratricopeptide repeat protein [Bacteroidota bacterium]|nr:tetratricopeptide repeat protein [Bacteroidota bacterium]
MKTNILTAALSFLTLAAVAQKDQVKNAEDAIDDGNYAEAQAQLKVAEQNLGELNDKWTESFYLYKGQAYYQDGKATSAEDLKTAAMAFEKAAEMGNEDAAETLSKLKNDMIQGAIDDQNSQNYASAAEKLLTSYEISKVDTIYLYYAANNYVQAENYDKAVEYLEMLNDLGYDGSTTTYTAVNIETGETETFNSKEQRDLMVKSPNYKDPSVEKEPSKKGEIASLIARIYINQKQYDKAVESIEAAKAANPDDVSLLMSEANMYYQMGDTEKAVGVLENAGKKDPNNPQTFNNIGLMYAELGKHEKAMENYNKALQLDDDYNEARINLIASLLNGERKIIDEMNSLGMSKADTKRYDELNAERQELYKETIPYLEKALEKDPSDQNVIKTAMNIYSNLGMQDKVDEMKAMLEQ